MAEVEGPFVLATHDPHMFCPGDLVTVGRVQCVVAKVRCNQYLTVKQFPRWKQTVNRICMALDIPPLFREYIGGAIIVFKKEAR